MSAKTLSPLAVIAAVALLGACDSGNRGGVALCLNPATQQLESCCVASDGSYAACSAIPGNGNTGGDALVGGDAGSTDVAGGGKDAAGQPGDTGAVVEDTTTPKEDTGSPTEDTGAPVEDAGEPVEDAGEPVEDTGTPVEDTGEPVEDTGGPVEDAGSCEECILGDELCDDEVTRMVCKETTPGCTAWKYIGCPDETVCADGACIGICDVELPCATPGQKKCEGNKVQACVEAAPGCAGWMTEKSCTASQTCKEGACVSAVACPAATKCTKLGDMKCDGTGKAVLGCEPLPADPSCLQWTTEKTCAGSQVCQDGACVIEGSLTCSELIGCLGSCQTPSCETDCQATATADGLGQYNALNDCASTSCSNFTGNQPSSFQACYVEKCKTQLLGCEGYFIPGPSGCAAFLACQGDCGSNQTCLAGCVDVLDYTGYLTVLKLYACLEQKCDPYYTSGTADYANCVQTSCGSALTACDNDM